MNKSESKIVFAGGCFWCTEAVFQRVEGVIDVVSGYTGGTIKNPAYREVCMGITGHAEGVLLTYDENKVILEELLEIFFATHDPTTLNRQGNDIGTQYRSEIFCTSEEQMTVCNNFIHELESQSIFEHPITTKVSRLDVFYQADISHQDYYNQNRLQPYCSFIIDTKIRKLKRNFTNKLKTTT